MSHWARAKGSLFPGGQDLRAHRAVAAAGEKELIVARVVVLLAMVVAVLTGSAQGAVAGPGHHNTDPLGTGCAASAATSCRSPARGGTRALKHVDDLGQSQQGFHHAAIGWSLYAPALQVAAIQRRGLRSRFSSCEECPMYSSGRWIAGIATLLGVTSLLVLPSTANAALLDATCTGSQVVTYSPGLRLLAQPVTVTLNTTYECSSSSVPGLTPGSSSATFQGNVGCLTRIRE
jgi:hypothetical protein